MPIKKNSLSQIGPVTGQLKRNFSSVERSQINAMRGMSGTLSSRAGSITGDVSNAFGSQSNTDDGRLRIASTIASSLESSGVTNNVARNFLSNTVSGAVQRKRGIHKSVSETPTDLSNPGNRMPSLARRSPNTLIDDKRKNVSGSPNNMFPIDLTESANAYIILYFASYNRTDPFDSGNLSSHTNVKLPLPDNFSQQYNIQYQPRDQGFLGDGVAGQVSGNSVRNSIENLKKGDVGISDAKSFASGLLKTTGSAALRSGFTLLDTVNDIAPVKDVAGAVMGMIPNPHKTIFFQGMDLRSFQWSWKLVPRNKEEAAEIASIIKKLKKHVLPKQGEITLEYPDLMKPEIGGDSSLKETVGDFRNSMVSGLSINYAGEGTSAFFKDGRPVSIVLSLEFQEVDIVTSSTVGE